MSNLEPNIYVNFCDALQIWRGLSVVRTKQPLHSFERTTWLCVSYSHPWMIVQQVASQTIRDSMQVGAVDQERERERHVTGGSCMLSGIWIIHSFTCHRVVRSN